VGVTAYTATVRKPIRLLILGSCVTRDALEVQGEPAWVELAGYYARSPLASAMDRRPFTGVDLTKIASPFQTRMVEQDLTGSARTAVSRGAWDLLVVDLIDDRLPLVVDRRGAVACLSPELKSSGYQPGQDGRLVKWASDEGFDRWCRGWDRLVRRLRWRRRLKDLRVNEAWWSAEPVPGVETPEGTYNPAWAADANKQLARRYEYMARTVGADQFYRFKPDELRVDPAHRWGPNFFHYGPDYYQALLAHLRSELD